jgi:hypothetical protein
LGQKITKKRERVDECVENFKKREKIVCASQLLNACAEGDVAVLRRLTKPSVTRKPVYLKMV